MIFEVILIMKYNLFLKIDFIKIYKLISIKNVKLHKFY